MASVPCRCGQSWRNAPSGPVVASGIPGRTVGAGTMSPDTFLRVLGPKPVWIAYAQPSRRPADGRYGENPNRLQHYYQFQVILKPNPPDLQELYLGSLAAILILVACIFLSFSRGSWAAALVGLSLTIFLTWWTSPAGIVRRRIARLSIFTVIAGLTLIAGLFTVEGVAERFVDRAQVTKDYDEGETGRFGNQIRGIQMLLERPAGFGPLRWRQTFGLDPHNSYIGSFANGGWLGGFAFLGIVLTTGFVGFRLCFTPSPYQPYAQIVWPALLMFFLQAIQIDVEKWRHVYMMLGMVWGLEAARFAWMRGERLRLARTLAERSRRLDPA